MSQNADGSWNATPVYNSDGSHANASSQPVTVSATAAPPLPVQVAGSRQPQMGICRDCRQEYVLRLGENDATARYFRCLRCGDRHSKAWYEISVWKDTCGIQ